MKKVSTVLLCAIGIGMMNAQQQQQAQQSYEIDVVNDNSVKHKRNIREKIVKFNILGDWKVTGSMGLIYLKTNPNAPEIEANASIFHRKRFIFDGVNVTIKDEDKILKKSKYSFTNEFKSLLMPDYTGSNAVDFVFEQKLLFLNLSPEVCYATLALQMNKTVDQIKAQFRAPEGITLMLSK